MCEVPKIYQEVIRRARKAHTCSECRLTIAPRERYVRCSSQTREGRNRIRAISVELDGHDFHERTREQASADRRRDRAFLSRGLVVIRFTGSDVYRDPAGVLGEIVALAHSNAKARK